MPATHRSPDPAAPNGPSTTGASAPRGRTATFVPAALVAALLVLANGCTCWLSDTRTVDLRMLANDRINVWDGESHFLELVVYPLVEGKDAEFSAAEVDALWTKKFGVELVPRSTFPQAPNALQFGNGDRRSIRFEIGCDVKAVGVFAKLEGKPAAGDDRVVLSVADLPRVRVRVGENWIRPEPIPAGER